MLSYLVFLILIAGDAAGTAGMPVLYMDFGPKGVALAGAVSSLPGYPLAFLYNPAGLTGLKRRYACFEHRTFFAGIRDELIVYSHPFSDRSKIGLALIYSSAGEVEKWSENGDYLGTFRPYSMILSLGLTRVFRRNFSAGVGFKFFVDDLCEDRGKGVAGDIGFLYSWQKFNFGLSLLNVGPALRYQRGKAFLPRRLRVGVSYVAKKAVFAAEVANTKGFGTEAGIGAEYVLSKTLSLRLGYKFRKNAEEKGLRAGFSVRRGRVQLEYTYVNYGILGDAHHIGIQADLGVPKRKPSKPKKRKLEKGRFEIAVVDAFTGYPLPARIELYGAITGVYEVGHTGRLEFEDPPAGWIKIRVKSEGFVTSEDSVLIVKGEEVVKKFALRREKKGVIVGFVRDEETHQPLTATIEFAGPTSGKVKSDRSLGGVYSIKGLGEGLYVLTVWADGYYEAVDSVYLKEGQRIDKDFYLKEKPEELVEVKFEKSGELADSTKRKLVGLGRAYEKFEVVYSTGPEKKITLREADQVRKFLIQQGVHPDSVVIVQKVLGTDYIAVRAYHVR